MEEVEGEHIPPMTANMFERMLAIVSKRQQQRILLT
jgi:hypothetical protein